MTHPKGRVNYVIISSVMWLTIPDLTGFTGRFFKKISTLLRYNSHTIKPNFKIFLPPGRETLYPLAVTPYAPDYSPWQLLICFLLLCICLFWPFHINGIIQHMAFCVWLISFSIMCSSMLWYVSVPPSFLLPNNIPLYGYNAF